MTIQTLRAADYIRSHGATVYGSTEKKLAVVSCWTRDNGRQYGETIEVIPNTIRAAREWLGY